MLFYFTSLVIVRQLDKNTVGYITYREGLQSSLNTTVITESEDTKAQVTIQVWRRVISFFLVILMKDLVVRLLGKIT